MTWPNPRSSISSRYCSSFQGIDSTNLYVLGSDGSLWLEHSPDGTVWNQTPPPRELVDQNVQGFEALDENNVYVLGADGNLWLEHSVNGKFGQVPPPREQVDGNVASFQAINSGQVYVLGDDGNLWLDSNVGGKFGQVPPPRHQVDANVAAFVALPEDLYTIYVLGDDGNLWLEHSVNGSFGQVPPPREHVDGNVTAFQPISYDDVYVLADDGNLWLEHSVNGKFGQVPPPREQVDGNVTAFQALSESVVFVLSKDGTVWNEHPVNGKFGTVPPPRDHLVASVADFQVLTPPPPDFPLDLIAYFLNSEGDLYYGGGAGVDGNVQLPLAYGSIIPNYLILTLVYAPPGTTTTMSVKSNVSYATGSSTGTTTSASSSFKAGVDVKAQVGGPIVSASVDFSASKTTTDSSSIQLQKSENFTIVVSGPNMDGINHDDDLFYLWLNPALSVTTDPHNNVTWEVSARDGQEMNVQYVTVGQLKNPSTIPDNLQQELVAAGLTQADYEAILSMNPFSFGPVAIDPNRYIAQPQALSYEYLPTETQTQAYTLTSSETDTSTHTVENTYGVTASASAGISGIVSASASFSFQWTNTNSTSATQGTTNSATALIGQPSSGWNGSTEVLVYWDTLYKSFMFAFPAPS
jgi:hypothetical protein